MKVGGIKKAKNQNVGMNWSALNVMIMWYLLVSMSRCVIDKEDKEVCVYDTCFQCVCVLEGGLREAEKGEKDE